MEPTPNTPPFHSAIRSLEPFIGTWVGEGIGFYPTIKVFKYGEEAVFSTWGKPIVSYSHRTWNLETKAPMHYECGFFRVLDSGKIEFINAQPTGITEICEGLFHRDKMSIMLHSKTKDPKVTQTKRVFELKDLNTLQIYFDMATTLQPLQPHLEAELTRV